MMKLNLAIVMMVFAGLPINAATLTISTTTNSRDYPISEKYPAFVSLNKDNYTIQVSDLKGTCEGEPSTVLKFNKPIALNCSTPTPFELTIRLKGDYEFTLNQVTHTLTLKRQKKTGAKKEFKRPIPQVTCDHYRGGKVTINLANTFPTGTKLREKFTGQIVKVTDHHVTLTPSPNHGGLVLLELADTTPASPQFHWRNANIYFVMLDRFNNGNPNNDHSYGRKKDGLNEIGTFHGGDLQGVIAKLDYIQSLGTDAIWLSPIVEQIHGFVGGGDSGSFPFYAYHGYWTRDFTKIDENLGTDDDLTRLVTEAHKRGMKVLLDVVLNHSGYAALADLQSDKIEVVSPGPSWPKKWANWTPSKKNSWHSYNDHIDYTSNHWKNWWGPDWIRATFPGYKKPGSGDTTLSLAGLPDFITESDKSVTPPQWLLSNPGTRVIHKDHYTVSNYLIEWQSNWVKRFGIDGFRVDTVKHVKGDVWRRLKQQASQDLAQWRKEHNYTDQPFWMMGEVWGHTAYRSPYFDDGFDAIINFDMQKKIDKGAACFTTMAETYQTYSNTLSSEPDFNSVSYISSHDTELFFARYKSFDMQRDAASALLLTPGAIQIYYGDEVARAMGPYADDFQQGTRSDMVWTLDPERKQLLDHWRKLGQFRHSHPAVGAGQHKELKQTTGYAFSRTLNDDKVVIAFVGK